ncbi:MAG TPA: hypothetical protein VJ981_03230, partial [Gammaproteobacteria bacterium]|nr:hypothetical protein [Gammaproteobacteria bacterium]
MQHRYPGRFLLVLILATSGMNVMADTPTAEEMWEIIQQQQQTIEELKGELAKTGEKAAAAESKAEAANRNVEAAADAIEEAGSAAGGGRSWTDKTTIGGYGELHYNNLDDENDAIGGNDNVDRVDFHRFVLYFGHEFTDRLRLFTELELEHALAGEGQPGEVELEQAWIEMDLTQTHRARAGLDILPIGIINPTHEPNTFYGVERNRVESEIIPATWWEAGAGFNGEVAPGWNYDLFAHSGLAVPTTGGSAFRPRSGRLKVANADDQDIAFTGRLRYTGMPGLEVGIAGQYQNDITGTADSLDIQATLLEGHIDYRHASGFGLRALYARWDMDDGPAGIGPQAFNADTLDGWYVEPAYRFQLPGDMWGEAGVFGRYENWDERNNIGGSHRFEEFSRWVAGINWWPHENVVLKFDYQDEDADGP